MESTLDLYMAKNSEIISSCADYNTTKLQLETLINDLSTIDEQINTDLTNMVIPTTFSHLHKLITVEITRARKNELQSSMYTLIKIRKENLKVQAGEPAIPPNPPVPINTEEERELYALETKEIENYINNVVNSCDCQKNRCNIINYVSHN